MKNIQIIAPSGGIDPSLVQAATHRLQSWGFEVHISPHALGQYGRFSASPANRLADLNAALHSDADYILCARGGYGLAQIIDQIKIQTGFNVRILSNSEARFLYYKALALKE